MTKIKYEKEKRINVLVAEDDKIFKMIYSKTLEKLGTKYAIAENGKEGLEKFINNYEKGAPFDLVISDIRMPVKDGIEMAENIREYENEKNIAITQMYAITTFEVDDCRKKCLDAGFNYFLRKESLVEDLAKIVQDYKK
ncbi:MAG: response regulator [Candidatus Nanoarchaeia archaeon]